MTARRRRVSLRDDRGGVTAFVVIVSIGLIAVMAFAIDAGSWFQEKRHVQAGADAAALAGAQDLPDTTGAEASAAGYADQNVTENVATITFPCTSDNSCIDVVLAKPTPAFFAKIVGINSVTARAHARAQVGTPAGMKNLAAIVVNEDLACKTDQDNCFGPAHTKDLDFDGAPGAGAGAGLVDLKGHNPSPSACTANTNTGEINGWITNGFAGVLPVNEWYASPPGVKNGVQTALNQVIGQVLLFPVFDTGDAAACAGDGGFHIIGWSAFVITQVVNWNNGQGHLLRGYFTEYIAHDVDSVPGFGGFGVKTITLTG